MKNWQKWYEEIVSNNKNAMLQAFLNGLKGTPFEQNLQMPEVKAIDDWQKLISYLPLYPNFKFDYVNDRIISDNLLFLACFTKAIKTTYYSNIYPQNIVSYIIFNRLKNTENLNDALTVKLLREIPYFWFDNCPNCDFANEEGWLTCSNCKCGIESSFD